MNLREICSRLYLFHSKQYPALEVRCVQITEHPRTLSAKVNYVL
jgi:hypothetical protein